MKFSEKESRALSKENQRLKREIEEYRSRERFESHIADLLVRDSGNVLLIFSGKEHRGIYVTSNVEKVFGVSAEVVLEDVTVLCRRSVSAGFFPDEKDIGNIEDDQTIEFTGEFENAASGARMWYTVGITRTGFGGEDIYVVVFKDRTSENYMNQHVQEILNVVEGSNQAKSNFLAGLSHDFRIPMNSISGYVTLLRKNADNPEKILEYANNISISCQSLMTLINHVVDMSRTGSANTTLPCQPRKPRPGESLLKSALTPWKRIFTSVTEKGSERSCTISCPMPFTLQARADGSRSRRARSRPRIRNSRILCSMWRTPESG